MKTVMMECIIKNLVNNKVTVDIKPNKYNELFIFNETTTPLPPKQAAVVSSKTTKPPKDVLAYFDCFWRDKTVSLLKPDDLEKQMNLCRQQLINDLTNEKQLFKKYKFKTFMKTESSKDVEAAIKTGDHMEIVAFYLAQVHQTNLAVNGKFAAVYDAKNAAYIDITSSSADVCEHSSGFHGVLSAYIEEQNLKKMLVKDIKRIACVLKLSTSKDGSQLLKEQLINEITAICT